MNKRLFYLITGLSIFTFIFYSRIIRIRLPKELFLFSPDINWIFLFVTINSILISLFILYKNFSLYFQKEERETLFSRFSNQISSFIDKSLLEGYDFICGFHPHSYDLVSKIAYLFFHFFKDQSIAVTIWINFLIRLVISLLFLIDIFFFFEFHYFYKSLFLLIIPLIFKILFFILRNFWPNIEEIEEIIEVEKKEGDDYLFTFKEDYSHLTNINYYASQYKLCYQIKSYFNHYDYYSPWFTIRKNIIIYSLFFLGWLGILIKNLYLLLQ